MPTVLVIDDEANILLLLRMALTARGYTVHTAQNAQAALDLFRQVQPDLTLMDLSMPGISGEEVGRVLAQEGARIIVMSAGTNLWARAQAMGALGVIEKPFDLTTLVEKLESVWHLAQRT